MKIRVLVAVFLALTIDGMDLQMLALALPSLVDSLHISQMEAGALGSYTLLGMGVGGILAGWLADRLGRVRVIYWSVVVFSIMTALIGLSTSYWQVALLRFISGFGLASVYSIGSILGAEYVSTRIRNTILGILQAGWSFGYVCAALLSTHFLPTYGWRSLFIFAIIPGAITLLLLHGIKDPQSWIETRKTISISGDKKNEFYKLWKSSKLRWVFILWSITSITLQFGYYGANTWLPSYLNKDLGVNLRSMSWYMAATYACMIVGKVVTGFLSDFFGRRIMWVFVCLLTAIGIPIIMLIGTPTNIIYLFLVFGVLYGAPYAINATYLSESFPTALRGTAVSTAYNIGRIGSVTSPILIGYIATGHSITIGLSILGISYAICGLIPGLFIREKIFDPQKTEVS